MWRCQTLDTHTLTPRLMHCLLTSSSTGGGRCDGGLLCAVAGPSRSVRSFWRCFLPRVCSSSCAALVNLRPQVTHTGRSLPAAASPTAVAVRAPSLACALRFVFRGACSPSPAAARTGRFSGGGSGGTASPRWCVASCV